MGSAEPPVVQNKMTNTLLSCSDDMNASPYYKYALPGGKKENIHLHAFLNYSKEFGSDCR